MTANNEPQTTINGDAEVLAETENAPITDIVEPTPPDTANVPLRVRVRARKAKRRGRGFNFRNAARILNPSLLDKLPGTSAPGLFEQLDWRGNAQLANDRLAALVDERRWLPTGKRGGSDGSRP